MTKYSVELQPEVRGPEKDGKPGKVITKARIVEFRRLSMSDYMRAFELGGQSSSEQVGSMKTRLAGMKLAILTDRGKPVTYGDLLDQKAWDERFDVMESQILLFAWNTVHEPDNEMVARVKNSLRTISG